MATSRPRRGSRARKTSPMPPAPRGERISYGPSFVPGESGIRLIQFSVADQKGQVPCYARTAEVPAIAGPIPVVNLFLRREPLQFAVDHRLDRRGRQISV